MGWLVIMLYYLKLMQNTFEIPQTINIPKLMFGHGQDDR